MSKTVKVYRGTRISLEIPERSYEGKLLRTVTLKLREVEQEKKIADVEWQVRKNRLYEDETGKEYLPIGMFNYTWDHHPYSSSDVEEDWFAGEKGETRFQLGFEQDFYGYAKIHFVDSQGNRRFPWFHEARGTIGKTPIRKGLIAEVQVRLNVFEDYGNNLLLRTEFGPVYQNGDVDSAGKLIDRYLEFDFKDNKQSKAIQPYVGWDRIEEMSFNIPLKKWVTLKMDIGEFAERYQPRVPYKISSNEDSVENSHIVGFAVGCECLTKEWHTGPY